MNEFRCSLLGGDDCERLAEDIESLRTSLASARAAIAEKDEALSLARDRMGLAINALPVKDIPEDLWAAFHIAKDALTTDGTELAALLEAGNDAQATLNRAYAHFDGTSLQRWADDFGRCAGEVDKALAAFERKGEG